MDITKFNIIKFSDLIDKDSFEKGAQQIAQSINLITQEIEKTKTVADEFAKAMGSQLKNEIKQLSSTSKQLAKDMADMENKMNQFKAATSNTNKVITDYEKENKRLAKELEEVRKKLDKVNQSQNNVGKSGQSAQASTTKLAQSFLGLASGAALVYKGIAILKEQLTLAVNSTIEFEQAMKEVQAISRASAEELRLLTENANRLGATTEKTAGEIANLQKELGKLGFNTTEILASTDAIVDLSTATGEDLAGSATVAAATLRAFGLEAIEMTRVVDVMAGSFVRSGLDLEKFRESMKLVAPIARATNIDLETTTAALSKLADAGLSGSLAGTALRNLFSEMADPTSKLVGYLSSINQEFADGVSSSEEMIRAFKALRDSGVGLAQAVEMVDVRARPAFFTIMNQIDAVEGLTLEYRSVEGEASRLAETMRDTLTNDIKIADSAFDAMRRNLVEQFTPAMRTVVQQTTLLSETMRFAVIDIVNYNNATKSAATETSLFGTTINAIIGLFGLLSDAMSVYTESSSVEEARKRMEDTEKTTRRATEATEQQIEVLKILRKSFEDKQPMKFFGLTLQSLGKDFENLSDSFNQGLISQEEAEKRLLVQLEQKLSSTKGILQIQQQQLHNMEVEVRALRELEKEQGSLNKEQNKRLSILLTESNRLRPLVKEYKGLEDELTKILEKPKIDPLKTSVEAEKTKLKSLQDQLKIKQQIAQEELKGVIANLGVIKKDEDDPAKRIALEQEYHQKKIELAQLSFKQELETIELLYKNDITYLDRRKLAYQKFLNDTDAINLEFGQSISDIFKKSVDVTTKNFQEVRKKSGDALKKLAEDRTEEIKDQRKKEEDALKEHEQKKQLIIAEAARAAQNITRSIFDNRQILRDAELEKIKVWEEERLRLAGDNEEAQLTIKKEAARREAEIKRKQAQDNKAEAMFQIIIDTAQAVMATLGETGFFGIPLAAIVGALGAAQLAVVAARPIPQFERGTWASPEGVAEVAERGRELIVDGKTGQARVAENRQYTYLTKNSVVVPNAQTEALLAGRTVDPNDLAYHALTKLVSAPKEPQIDYDKMQRVLVESVKSIPRDQTFFDENGVRKFIVAGNARVQRLNKRYKY